MASGKTVTLLLGGARSGKSRYAQVIASAYSRVTFIATAQRSDGEMRARIARHQQERPAAWKTVEVTTELDQAILEQSAQADLLLVDCLTLYVSNLMGHGEGAHSEIQPCFDRLSESLKRAACSVVLVSNEVGSGIVPMHPVAREYRDLLGSLNQKVAVIADRVVLMVAGLPLVVKDAAAGKRTKRNGA